MNVNDLVTGRFASHVPIATTAQPVSSGKNTSPTEKQLPYAKGEATVQQIEEPRIFLPYGKKHAEKYGMQIVPNLEIALKMRSEGLAVMTLREADIAARMQLQLDSHFLIKGLCSISGMIIEGIPGEEGNVYLLREFYNRGVEFKKNKWNTVDEAHRQRATQAMKDTLYKMLEMQLPAWPEEEANGFPLELTKPEYMTWGQYNVARKYVVKRTDLHDTSDPDSDIVKVAESDHNEGTSGGD